MDLQQQLDASERLATRARTLGYRQGLAEGYNQGLIDGLDEALKEYAARPPEEFAEWAREAMDVISIEREHQL
jgi:flagellar biosynthesis/type III secretory pathway protein FliH